MTSVPVFPLNAVVFPGVVVPLHVFEDRYRALVRDLRALASPADRVFAIPAIREGYEVGEHGVQSMHRIGTLVQLSSAATREDGTFDIEVTGRHRIRIEALDSQGDYLRADVTELADGDEAGATLLADRVRSLFEQYAALLARITGVRLDLARAPRDPAYLSYWMSAVTSLPMRQRQELLEAETAGDRLRLLDQMLRAEMAAIRVLPSLPATELARNRWSPN